MKGIFDIYKKLLCISIVIIEIFNIILLSCGPSNYKFYKFLNIYLSKQNISDDSFSLKYKDYLSYYNTNLDTYKIDINSNILQTKEYNSFKLIKYLDPIIISFLIIFDLVYLFYNLNKINKVAKEFYQKVIYMSSKNLEDLAPLEDFISKKINNCLVLNIIYVAINIILDIIHIIYICKSLKFSKKVLIGGGKYYKRLRDRSNTSIAFDIFNILIYICYIYFCIRILILLKKRFYEKIAPAKITSPALEDKVFIEFPQTSSSRKFSNFDGYHLRKKNFKYIEKPQIYKSIPDNQINQKNYDIEITRLKSMTNIMIDDINKEKIINEIKNIEINNQQKQEERIEKIKMISNKINNEIMNKEEYLKNVLEFGTNIKNSIIYDICNNKNIYLSNNEIKDAKEDSVEFSEYALSKLLSNEQIMCTIEKKTSCEEESLATLKLILNGKIFNKILTLKYDLGEEENYKILTNQEEQKKFINKIKEEYSIIFNCSKDDIIITNLRSSPLLFDLYIEGTQPNEDILKNIKKESGFIDYTLKGLMEACRLSPSMFDSKYNVTNGEWGENKKSGPPENLVDYDPPTGYIGYGLCVQKLYGNVNNKWLGTDNSEGEWNIAYHGTSYEFVKSILENGFGAGSGQCYRDDNNINKLSNSTFEKCGEGVYCTPNIKEAEKYAKTITIGNSNYKLILMCRVNPYKCRIAERLPDYWIVSGDPLSGGNIKKYDDEIRPYRILLKKI